MSMSSNVVTVCVFFLDLYLGCNSVHNFADYRASQRVACMLEGNMVYVVFQILLCEGNFFRNKYEVTMTLRFF